MNLENDLPLGQTFWKCNKGMSSFREWISICYPQSIHVTGSFGEIANLVLLIDPCHIQLHIRSRNLKKLKIDEKRVQLREDIR